MDSNGTIVVMAAIAHIHVDADQVIYFLLMNAVNIRRKIRGIFTARVGIAGFMYGLKPVPFKTPTYLELP
jgi:hypothetical protein